MPLVEVAGLEIKAPDERGQITYSSGPFRGSEAFRDACRSTVTKPRLLTGATHTHTLPSSPRSRPLSLTVTGLFSLPAPVFSRHLGLAVFLSTALISLVLARFCMHALCLLSPICLTYQPAFMRNFFFSFCPSSVVGVLLFFHSRSQ